MNFTQDLERLAHLHQQGQLTSAEFEAAKARLLAQPSLATAPADFRGVSTFPGIRRQSEIELFGLPLWAIAVGPAWERGERRGHARGIVAIGDLATGVVALGGVARGVVALGGLALGLLTVGGASAGLLFAFGGLALGGLAIGGLAAGGVAVGGLAIGYYAAGGGALGAHTISAMHQDPAALEFFRHYLPWLPLVPRG